MQWVQPHRSYDGPPVEVTCMSLCPLSNKFPCYCGSALGHQFQCPVPPPLGDVFCPLSFPDRTASFPHPLLEAFRPCATDTLPVEPFLGSAVVRFLPTIVYVLHRPLFWQLLELFFAPPAYLKFFGSCIPFAPAILLELMRPSRDS